MAFSDNVSYIAYYARSADPGGLDFWAGRLQENNGDLGGIIGAFGNSQEYQNRFGSLSNDELVNNIYQNLFNRSAEPGGLVFYVGLLERKEKTLASIALDILNGATGSDADIIENKLAVANHITALVRAGRTSDTGQELLTRITADGDTVTDAKQQLGDIPNAAACLNTDLYAAGTATEAAYNYSANGQLSSVTTVIGRAVVGAVEFQELSAIKIEESNKTSNVARAMITERYFDISGISNLVIRELGEVDKTVLIDSITAYSPGWETRFDLSVGQSYEQQVSKTVSGSQAESRSRSTTFQGIETITVPAGTFQACRFEEHEGTTNTDLRTITTRWVAEGHGVVVKKEMKGSIANSIVYTNELMSLKINGQEITGQ